MMLWGLIYQCVSKASETYLRQETCICVALGVMAFDVCEFGGVLERWDVPVQMPQPLVDMGIARTDIPDICLYKSQYNLFLGAVRSL